MPVYTYHCDNCRHEFDERQGFDDPALTMCPACGKPRLQKVYKPAQVVFRGSGYYVTDSRGRSSTLSTNGKSENGNGSNESKSDSKPETKTETKSETKTKTDGKADGKAKPAAKPE
ncbi:MAG: hypothetical protein HYZ26_12805 [Chloroflexi bacterium]|nr:hypothetical protein [Chloroflexota bacterium]